MWFSGFAQEDWFGFNRYRADNERIIASDDGCHPKPDTYYIMEMIVMEKIKEL